MTCKICKNQAVFFEKGLILNKYNVGYFKCKKCGFVQTENPYWLEESYSEAIAKSDVGLLHRNQHFARISAVLIRLFFDKQGKYIDYGGGYGLYTRMMRDLGFDFYWFDRSCQNLFAKGFEADVGVSAKYELLTAFEVFEHLPDPHEDLKKMTTISSNILFSTLLLPSPVPQLNQWWYYGLDHGQHISLYSYNSLKYLADKYDRNFYTNGTLHLFTRGKMNSSLFKVFSIPKIAYFISHFIGKNSFLTCDLNAMRSDK